MKGVVDMLNDVELLKQILYSDFENRRKEFQKGFFNLAHYTHSKTAINIIRNGQIWLGDIRYMNDYSEISNGIGLFNDVVKNTEEGKYLKTVFSRISPEILEKLMEGLNKYENIFLNTYAFCLTEFRDSDKTFGKLSMWRAYANEDGVALVFNNKIMQDIAGIDFIKMFYYDKNDLKQECAKIANELEKNYEYISRIYVRDIVNVLAEKIGYVFLSLKHKAFIEEKEWRVLYNPNFIRPNCSLELGLETCFKEPRFVYKFNFEGAGLKINDILDKVLVGPSNNSEQLREIFIKVLNDKGVINAEEKVICTHIPLRGK